MINKEANGIWSKSSIQACESGHIGAEIHTRRPFCIDLEANVYIQLVVQTANKACRLEKIYENNGI